MNYQAEMVATLSDGEWKDTSALSEAILNQTQKSVSMACLFTTIEELEDRGQKITRKRAL
jgi:hypothetical protein